MNDSVPAASSPSAASASASPENTLKRGDIKVLGLSALGGALEFYDFVIFVFFASVIGQLFFPPDIPEWLRQVQTYGIFAAGYLARPLGGIIMAHFGDTLGRKKMFTLSIFLMSLPTLLMGLLPTYAVIGLWAPLLLVILRIFQGAAVGGEVPGAWVFVSEHVAPRHNGLACGTLSMGLVGGILLGSLMSSAINHAYSVEEISDFGWRIPFIVGGVLGLVSVYLRRWLHETPVFAEMQQKKTLAAELPMKMILREQRPAIAVAMAATWVLTAAIVVVILMTPNLISGLEGLSRATVASANSLAIVAVCFGCVISGYMVDRIGAGVTMALWSGLLGVTYWVFLTTMHSDPSLLIPLYCLTGFSVGIVGVVPSIAIRGFPPVVRFTGLSFSYNVAYAIFGGFTPIMVAAMMESSPLSPIWYVGALSVMGVVLGLWLAVNPRGREMMNVSH
ncbi:MULTISPECIES: MFS transporter [Cobetia]|uniref:MFS transporter n=1 Tax=Cobetia crustatorum TaxID=553385 RepID=A0A558HU79_9GAMM|nr:MULTISPECIES: MFS transporter [Cobetia]TVU72683.1 MFS transporter [Cobetia crustatorum]